jgi:tetraacyldisaccharide 4'-kinase
MGDEPLVLTAHAAGVPVLVGRDRGVVGLRAISAFGADVLVLDDGFQHYRLARDVDILTVDGRFGFGNGRVLPRGPLREPIGGLSRAHAVGIVDGPLAGVDAERLERHAVNPFLFRAQRQATRLRRIRSPRAESEPVTALAGARVGLLAALGQPDAFRRTLEARGATVVAEQTFRDHHRYRARDLKRLGRRADVWVTTEKDAVKILPRWTRGIDLRVLTVELAVAEEESLLDWVEERIGQKRE